MKMCRGHYHAPGTFVSLAKFYTHKGKWRAGKPFSECIECWKWRKENPAKLGTLWTDKVMLTDAALVIEELRRRIGPVEAARRAGLNEDYLAETRLLEQEGIRLVTFNQLRKVLIRARLAGEDNFDPIEHNKQFLVPGRGLNAANQARRAKRDALKHAERRRRARSQFVIYARKEAQEKWPVKDTTPDKTWWHWTGQEWLPRYGTEMLGKDF